MISAIKTHLLGSNILIKLFELTSIEDLNYKSVKLISNRLDKCVATRAILVTRNDKPILMIEVKSDKNLVLYWRRYTYLIGKTVTSLELLLNLITKQLIDNSTQFPLIDGEYVKVNNTMNEFETCTQYISFSSKVVEVSCQSLTTKIPYWTLT